MTRVSGSSHQAKWKKAHRFTRRQNWSPRRRILSSCLPETILAAFEAFVARDVAWRTHLRREECLELAGCAESREPIVGFNAMRFWTREATANSVSLRTPVSNPLSKADASPRFFAIVSSAFLTGTVSSRARSDSQPPISDASVMVLMYSSVIENTPTTKFGENAFQLRFFSAWGHQRGTGGRKSRHAKSYAALLALPRSPSASFTILAT